MSLRSVSRGDVRALCELRLADHQDRLVAPAAYTVAEGHYEPGALLRAIYAEDEPVGVLLVETEAELPHLVRFMVDASHQGRASAGRLSSGWQMSCGKPDGRRWRPALSRLPTAQRVLAAVWISGHGSPKWGG